LRQLIGVPIEDTLEPWCHEACGYRKLDPG